MNHLKLKIPPVVVTAIFGFLMWALSKTVLSSYFNVSIPNVITGGVGILSVLWGVAGLWEFWKHKTTVNPHRPEKTQTIVKTGIYKYSRNPMYVALLFLLLAWVLYLEYWPSAFLIPLFVVYMNRFQIEPEEQMLRQIFGSDYKRYEEEVNRWLFF